MLLLCYSKCSTCMKAKKHLKEKGVSFEERSITDAKPTAEELRRWIRLSGLTVKKFFNTSGNLYKSMQLKDKLPDMSEEEMIELLARDGMLIKRPLLIDVEKVLVGYQPKDYDGLC